MGALKQSVVFMVAGFTCAAIVAYIDAYHVLEIDESFKFRTPAAVWEFQFNIWWPVVLIMTFLFLCTSQIARRGFKANSESSYVMLTSFAAIVLVSTLYLAPMALNNSGVFLVVMIGGPIVAAATIEYCHRP